MGGLRAGEGKVPQIPTHHGVDIWGSGAELGPFGLQGLESGLLKQALAACSSRVHGLEGGEGRSGGFGTSCEHKEDRGALSEGLPLSAAHPSPRLRGVSEQGPGGQGQS